ncbi:MAG: LPS assembly protein LptD [Akkermansiaceae bacterium]
MLKLGAWMISPLLCLPLQAQDAQVLPDQAVRPPAEMITPVPAPEIPLGDPGTLTPVMPKELNINNQGGSFTGDLQTGIFRLGGPVKIEGDSGLEIFADTALLNTREKKVTLEGHVSVYQGNLLQRGERAVYFYERKFLDASGLRVSLDPILLESGKFTVEDRGGKQVFVGEDAGITTHDVEDPNFWIRSKKTTIYPGEKVVFNDLRVYAGDTPVFWLPYLSQPLNAELGYHFIPGARSNWGPYLLNSYGIMLGGKNNPVTGENEDAWLLSRWRLDLLASRGVGVGVDLVDTRMENNDEISGFSAYYLNDLAPDTERSGVPRGFVNEDRYEFELKHRLELDFPDEAEWRLDTNLTWLSDRYYLEDFNPTVYRTNPAPDNTIGIYRRDDQSLLSLHARLRINDFYRTDTRLPEIAYDQARAPLFGLPLLHEGNTSFGIIGEQASDATRNAILNPLLDLTTSDPEAQQLLSQLSSYERGLAEEILALPLNDPRRDAIRTQLLDSSYSRFNTYQEFSMPFMLGSFLSLTPQAGLGYTNYGAVEGPVDSFDRTYLHVGAEASVKFSKDLGAYKDSKWGLDGLMHVIQPYSAWSLISTDDFDPTGPLVDRLTPTTRPRPLDPTRYTAIDEMQNWNVLRLGGRNRLLTKRDHQTFEWLYLDSYIDAFIDDPEGDRNISNLYNDVRWQPVPWVGLDLETQFPIADGGSGFSEFNTRLRFLPTDNLELSLGYRMLNGHPVLVDSNRIDLQAYTRINENWGFGFRQTFEMADNTLEYEQYSVHRDLGNWVAGIGFTRRDNRLEEEYGVVFSLTLKDFPSASLPFEIDAE